MCVHADGKDSEFISCSEQFCLLKTVIAQSIVGFFMLAFNIISSEWVAHAVKSGATCDEKSFCYVLLLSRQGYVIMLQTSQQAVRLFKTKAAHL